MTREQHTTVRLPGNEKERLEALHALEILDTQRDQLLDGLAGFASRLFDMPTVLVSLVDADRQWFKAACGMTDSEHPREWSFCSLMVGDDLPMMMIEDTLEDPRVCNNPLVTADNPVRFYAGSAIRSAEGYMLGSFCLLDSRPRALTGTQLEQLQQLAGIVQQAVQQYGHNRDLQTDLIQRAFYDPVTGLPTRALLCERLRGIQALPADRNSDDVTLAIINPSRFRVLNQMIGREAGDSLLREIGKQLAAFVGDQGIVARLHEDRFALLVSSGIAREPGWLEALQEALARPFRSGGVERRLDFSIGIAEGKPDELSSPEDLIEQAQLALRQSRPHSGTSISTLSSAERDSLTRTAYLEEQMRAAIDQEQLFLVYQPIVDMTDGSLGGVEVLVRWRLEGSLIPPAEFIPIAEESGAISAISRWILESACIEFQRQYGNQPGVYLSVNIGAQELYDHDFVTRVETALQRSGLASSRLRLEVTEHSVIHDMAQALHQMHKLVAMGVHFSLDDFGTGFASLRYLQLMPVDTLKIDRCFIDGLPDCSTDTSIVRATIAMARSLGLNIVAEGVENQMQASFLLAENVKFGQGFFYARPDRLEVAAGPHPRHK